MLPTTALLSLLFLFFPAQQPVYAYVAALNSDSVLLAWGTTEKDFNSIGRGSRPLGAAQVRIDGRSIDEESQNWVLVSGLQPDQVYPYQILVDGRPVADSWVRTHPRQSRRLAFLVLGDFGKGNERQREVARAMTQVFEEKSRSGNPVRFAITTGDNIYGKHLGVTVRHSGGQDSHWQKKFFEPYRELLRHIPFYPSPGNHDGDDTEKKEDMPVYADNFFLPPFHSLPGSTDRFYGFSAAGLADFFSLDSTKNSLPDGSKAFEEEGPQHKWVRQRLAESKALWKIVYFHNAAYTAGPKYEPGERLRYLEGLFAQSGVQVVFNGHEHNFQASQPSETGGILYVVSGAAGSLRDGDVRGKMARRNMAAWAGEAHFLLVEIEGDEMRIQPIGTDGQPLRYYLRDGSQSSDPLLVRR